MKRLLISLWGVLAILLLGVSTPRHVQSALAPSDDAENARHSLAIGLLRSINTAELDSKLKHGKYATWETLVDNGDFTTKGTKWASKNDPFANLGFSRKSEILPGWNLRLNLTADAKAYDLLLEDATDDDCGYAAITDERGVIRQGKAIDCKI